MSSDKAEKLVGVYADAVYELAKGQGKTESVADELTVVGQMLKADAKIWKFAVSPVIQATEKIKAIGPAVKGSVSDVTYNFLGVLMQRHRLELLPEIAQALRHRVDHEAKRKKVQITSTYVLKDDEVNALKQALEGYFKSEISLEFIVKPELLGGVRIQCGDIVIDGSIEHKLSTIKKALSQRKIIGEEFYEN